jgi:DNA helicase II / ATP-dependent DNA helicase PcrA
MSDFVPSPQQLAIFDAIQNTNDSLMVVAVAGSGKTTTIVQAAKLIPRDCFSVFLAFNKSIALELQDRLPYWVQARTFHSHSFAALRNNLPKPTKVDPDKVRVILFKLLDEDRNELFLYLPFVRKLVDLAKGLPTRIVPWRDLIDYHELECEGDEEFGISLAHDVFIESQQALETIDYNDMLYLTWAREAAFPLADFVFVDEAQDLNAIQHALLLRMLKPKGRVIVVGDPWQSIYAFRGADSDSMDKLSQQFNCRHLPLSVSYRCSKSVVREAQQILSEWNNQHES